VRTGGRRESGKRWKEREYDEVGEERLGRSGRRESGMRWEKREWEEVEGERV